jgi:hypothetical protein
VGRFLTPDPIGFAGGLNVYGYCDGDSVNAVDPSGLDPFDAEAMSDDDILYFGRNTRKLTGALFHETDMAFANGMRQKSGYERFGFGNRPVGNDLLAIHQLFGQIGGGGPTLAAGALNKSSSLTCPTGGGGGIFNTGGSYGVLNGAKNAGEVAHHMPQNAYMKTLVGTAGGPALGMTTADHALTRTFRGKGVATMRRDALLSPVERLLNEISDIRRLFGRKYNKGMLQMIKYARTLPWFARKPRVAR